MLRLKEPTMTVNRPDILVKILRLYSNLLDGNGSRAKLRISRIVKTQAGSGAARSGHQVGQRACGRAIKGSTVNSHWIKSLHLRLFGGSPQFQPSQGPGSDSRGSR